MIGCCAILFSISGLFVKYKCVTISYCRGNWWLSGRPSDRTDIQDMFGKIDNEGWLLVSMTMLSQFCHLSVSWRALVASHSPVGNPSPPSISRVSNPHDSASVLTSWARKKCPLTLPIEISPCLSNYPKKSSTRVLLERLSIVRRTAKNPRAPRNNGNVDFVTRTNSVTASFLSSESVKYVSGSRHRVTSNSRC